MTPPALPALEASPFSPSEGPTGPVRGGWRVVHQPRKAERKGKGTKALAIQEAPPPPAPIAPVKPVPSWATWKRPLVSAFMVAYLDPTDHGLNAFSSDRGLS